MSTSMNMDDGVKRVLVLYSALLLLLSSTTFHFCSGSIATTKNSKSNDRFRSSIAFPINGNVYPLGYYSVSLTVGNPPKIFEVDIDTGSDLTWIQCDAPCTGCTKPRDQLYKPRGNLVPCKDPICSTIHSHGSYRCDSPNEQCDYVVNYADQGSSLGVLVSDHFLFKLINGSVLGPRLTFGCGYDLQSSGTIPAPPTCGVLGLGNGKASTVSQLQTMGLTRNVIGHCLSRKGGGFLFFGDHLVPSSGVTWTHSTLEDHYSLGAAELLFGGKSTGMKGLDFIFDSGTSYTYFDEKSYQRTLKLIKNNLNGKPLEDEPKEKALPVCWKTTKPVKQIEEIKSYFMPLIISSTKKKKVQMQIPPEAYLIVTERGNICLGILNSNEVGLGNLNIIGDIFLQDKMVIYDNEKRQIGWADANCNILPNADGNDGEGICQPLKADFGLKEECTALRTSDTVNNPIH